MSQKTKTLCFFLIALFISSAVYAQTGCEAAQDSTVPGTDWQTTFGQGPWMTDDKSQAHSLIQIQDSGYAIAARYQNEVCISKLNSKGTLLWTHSYSQGEAVAIVESEDGFAVAYNSHYGSSGSAISVLKIDSKGELLWDRTLIAKDRYMTLELSSMAKTQSGGYVVAGSISNLNADTLETDFLLIEIDADGQTLWNQTYGGPDYDKSSSVIATADGGYAVTGFTASFGPHGTNYWLIKTDSEGNLQWSRTYGLDVYGYKNRDGLNEGLAYGAGDNLPEQVIQTADGGYALFGSQGQSINSYYPWLVKTDAYGRVQWNQTYDGGVAPWQYGYSVAQTGDGGYALAATQRENAMNGPYQTWILKTDENGKVIWTHNYREYTDRVKSPELVKVTPCTIIQTHDNSLAFLATVQGYPQTDYFTVIKTKPFLPPALPPPENAIYNPSGAPQMQFPTVTINKSGSVTPASAPISISGNTYILNSDFQGNIVVDKNDVIIEGNGHKLYGNGSLSQGDGSEIFIQFTNAGITLNGTSNVEIKNLQLYGFQYQIKTNNACNRINIHDNTFSGPYGRAIYCWNGQADNLNIVNNAFNQVDGLTLFNVKNSEFSHNTLTDSNTIWIPNSNQIKILYNTLFNTGIRIGDSGTNNLIAANTVTGASLAISSPTNSIVTYNMISYCGTALEGANNCIIYNNNIEGCGTAFSASGNNVIYQNNVIDCDKLVFGHYSSRVYYPMLHNTWSKDSNGNYWSSYNGTDSDDNGVGDTPLVIDENNVDDYPLTSKVTISVPADLGVGFFDLVYQQLWIAALGVVLVVVAIVVVFVVRRKNSVQPKETASTAQAPAVCFSAAHPASPKQAP